MTERVRKGIMIGVIAIGAVLCVVITIMKANKENEINATIASDQQTLDELNASLTHTSSATTETVDQIQATLYTASATGARVAVLENDARSINVEMSGGTEALQANAQETASYFDDDSANLVWYDYDISQNYAWTFESTYSYDRDQIPVVWTCKTTSGELLASTTAMYHADTGKFTDVVYHVTTTGQSYIPVEDEGTPEAE